MNRTDQSRTRRFAPSAAISVKIISISLVGLLLVGTAPVTHSYPSAKADFSNIWLVAKDFWDSLEFFKSKQLEQETFTTQSTDSVKVDNVAKNREQGLKKLKTHPECRSIYVSEYLPTFNSQVIEKCEKAIKHYEQKQLFDTYVQQLCLNPGISSLDRQQLGEIQMRLRKYALTFPQSNIDVAKTDIDGLYGAKTCTVIANYQIISKSDVIDGVADTSLYNDLVKTIPLTETEVADLNWRPAVNQVVAVKSDEPTLANSKIDKPTFQLPKNPFKRIAFCLRNSHIKQCNSAKRSYDLAKADINHR